MLLQLHDEIIIETPDDETEKVKKIIKEEMESAIKLSVELLVEVEIGNSWYEI